MIDKARGEPRQQIVIDPDYVRRLRDMLRDREAAFGGFVTFAQEWFDALATDYLALRSIVEALAAIPPFYIDAYQDRRCAICEAKIDPPIIVESHAKSCAYRRAVALVGPAGGAQEEAE